MPRLNPHLLREDGGVQADFVQEAIKSALDRGLIVNRYDPGRNEKEVLVLPQEGQVSASTRSKLRSPTKRKHRNRKQELEELGD